MTANRIDVLPPEQPVAPAPPLARPNTSALPVKRPSIARFALAFGVAAISDAVALFASFVPPVEWVVDGITALLLFLILGRRWAILPGLVAEAIPGLAMFPLWLLVVLSIFLYDEIKLHKK